MIKTRAAVIYYFLAIILDATYFHVKQFSRKKRYKSSQFIRPRMVFLSTGEAVDGIRSI